MNLGRPLWNTDMPRKEIGDDKIDISFLEIDIVCLHATIFWKSSIYNGLLRQIFRFNSDYLCQYNIKISINNRLKIYKRASGETSYISMQITTVSPQLSKPLAPNRWQAIFQRYFNDIHWYVVTSLRSNTFHHSDVTWGVMVFEITANWPVTREVFSCHTGVT